MFAARFRECAARALLLPRRQIGKRQPLWQQRQRATQLLEVYRAECEAKGLDIAVRQAEQRMMASVFSDIRYVAINFSHGLTIEPDKSEAKFGVIILLLTSPVPKSSN